MSEEIEKNEPETEQNIETVEASEATEEKETEEKVPETAEEKEPETKSSEPEKPEKPEEKKRFWQREKKEKEKKKDEKDEKIEQLSDQLRRLMAEFDNYRKRTEKEKSSMFDLGTTSAVEKILPVVDNLERGLQSVPESERENATYTGMDMIHKQLVKTLTDMGVEPIEAEGKEFDPNLHNAVMQTESETLAPGTVAMVLQKGYTYKGTVIRHAMVGVVSEQ